MNITRKNKILVVCLALLLTLSVGYALFSETITINGTATAKGSFDIEFSCTGGVSDELWPHLISASKSDGSFDFYDFPRDNGYSDDSCDVINNKITYNTALDYPGAARYFIVKATNKGTITAGIEDNYAYYGGNTSSETCIYKKEDDSLVKCQDTSIAMTGGFSGHSLLIAAEDKNGNLYGWDNGELENGYMDDEMIWNIEQGESLYFMYLMFWDSTWTDSTKYLTHTETAEMPFVQYNK